MCGLPDGLMRWGCVDVKVIKVKATFAAVLFGCRKRTLDGVNVGVLLACTLNIKQHKSLPITKCVLNKSGRSE